MTTIRSNENEFKSYLIPWLNKYIQDGGYPFESATGDVSVGNEKNTLFPDVQLWINREASQGFCGWELKTTTVKADDKKLLENAIDKAGRMNAKYFVTWNMQDAIIWQITDAQSKKIQRLLTYGRFPIDSVQDLKNPAKRTILEERARDILSDLAKLCQEGHLTYLGTDDWFFIHRLTDTSYKVQPFFKQKLLEMSSADPQFRQKLNQWAVKQGFIVSDQDSFLSTIANQIVYQLLGRLLFFQVLRRFRSDLPSLNLKNFSEKQANLELKKKFAEIRNIDYQAIFEEDLPDTVPVPKEALPDLAALIDEFERRDFANLPQEVLGSVFENLIPAQERHRLGQFFTPENLVDFITAFCIRKAEDNILDPTCGTGTFLVRAYDRFKNLFAVRNHQKLLSQIWGIDIAPFPAELATLNLYRQDISNIGNFPRILKKDFFLVRGGQTYEFPPNKPFQDNPNKKINEPLPVFDAIIGNPPYIRQEIIDKAVADYSVKTINPALAADRKLLAPDVSKVAKQFDPIELSGQADIYASMFVHATALLKEGGRLGFVTSNSWLGAEYGQELQAFFLRHFKIVAIVESRVEPWFETAQVNTIFTILEKCENQSERENHLAKFVSVKKKLKDLIPWDMQFEASKRWHNLDILVSNVIEQAGNKFIIVDKNGKITVSVPHLLKDFEDSNFRIRIIKQGTLEKEVPEKFGTGHWGRFLRAPGVYFELRQILRDKLASLSDKEIAGVNFGIKSGITEFFNVSPERAKEFGIEKEFLSPFVISFREIEKPVIDSKDTKFKLFNCRLDKNELRRLGKKGALKYIEWGEQKKTSGRGAVGRGGVPWPQVPSVKNRVLWYDVGDRQPGQILINRFIGARIFFPLNIESAFISDTFFEVNFVDKKLRNLWTALMNSSLFYLFVYVHGRVDWSQGPLRIYGPEIQSLLIPDARKIPPQYQKKIIEAFQPILKRKIKNISEEIKQEDRKEFDLIVLEALGLEPKKYLNLIYAGLVDLVEARVSLGKMQVVEKKEKKTKDIPKIKEEVLKEVLPDGLRPFPENFVSPRSKYRQIVLSPGKWRLGDYFMGRQDLVNDKGEKYQAATTSEAEYILFAQKPDSHFVKLPQTAIEMVKAVQSYKKYLKDIRQKLVREFVMRTGDQNLSERLGAEVIEELGVLF
jgi:type I restriction-modification system DNA methylase subunit